MTGGDGDYEHAHPGFPPDDVKPEPVSTGTIIKVAASFIAAIIKLIRKKREVESE